MDSLSDFFDLLYSQIVPIPLDNVWSYLYVILNSILLLFATFASMGES